MTTLRAVHRLGVVAVALCLLWPAAADPSGEPARQPAPGGLPAAGPPPQEQPPPPQPPTTAPGQRPSFRAGVELVSLNVTVTDPSGRYITELDAPDFQVFEDGAQQQVTFFTRSNLPIALSILLDTSASMESKLDTAQEAAIGFVRRLRPQDLAQVVDFDSRVQVIQGFTNGVADLEGAIRRTNPGGSTSLHNAIYIALKELKRIQARATEDIRRQAIVLLSDGEDTSSLVSFDEVLDLAKRSETSIYAIGLRTPGERSRGFSDAEYVLRQLTQQTGGRLFFTRQISELASVYGQIAEELSSQYTIGYTSRNPKRDGAWRRIVVRVSAPNASARAKQGYYAPTS